MVAVSFVCSSVFVSSSFSGSPSSHGLTKTKTENVGLGGIVFNDKFGPTSRIGGSVSYSYHFYLSEKIKMSLALAGGFTQFKIDKVGWNT